MIKKNNKCCSTCINVCWRLRSAITEAFGVYSHTLNIWYLRPIWSDDVIQKLFRTVVKSWASGGISPSLEPLPPPWPLFAPPWSDSVPTTRPLLVEHIERSLSMFLPTSRDVKLTETSRVARVVAEKKLKSQTAFLRWEVSSSQVTTRLQINRDQIAVFPPFPDRSNRQPRSYSRAAPPASRGGSWRRPRCRVVTWSNKRWASAN